jgi:hypothetical protein
MWLASAVFGVVSAIWPCARSFEVVSFGHSVLPILVASSSKANRYDS